MLYLLVSLSLLQPALGTVRVAIVGGGIGGSTAAFTLRELQPSVETEVYEAASSTTHCGRLRSFTADATVEAGGAVVHARNRHVSTYLQRLGLQKAPPTYGTSSRACVYAGSGDMAFCTHSSWVRVVYAQRCWTWKDGVVAIRYRHRESLGW